MATQAPPRVSRNVSLPAGRQPPTVAMLARRTLSESDLEPGAATAPSGSSSSSSLSSRSNESNTVAAEQQASQSDWSEEEEPLAAQWADSLPPHVLDGLDLSAALRKRQEVIHELIVSEGSHVRWLRVLSGVFLRPLERHASLLAADELRALFPNLPAVRERHSRLYSDLRTARNDAGNHVVQIRPVADALLNTLGESGYALCVSKFCRGQRMALDALRERRRKSKELHQFLAAREQLPHCGRLQLKDMLACVWQRLTKYQLLLEGILKTVVEGEETEEDVAKLRRAHDVAKDVLHRVDTAIRTAENEHRDKVLFRPNAAVRNTFFLMNINGVQMHELSANSAPEYASWVKHIQEAPLAKLTDLKASIPTQHAHSRSADDSGINVSRNPSDASEKSSSTAPGDEPVEPEKDRTSVERTSAEREDKRTEEEKRTIEAEDRSSTDKEAEVNDKDDKHKPRRPTVGRISTQGPAAPPLESPVAVTVRAPAAHAALTAHKVYTHAERLRRLDAVISKALRAKSSIVGSVLGVPPQNFAQFADLAVADALGEVESFEMLPAPEELDVPTDTLDPVDADVLEKELSEALTDYELPLHSSGCEDNEDDEIGENI
ncbi:hypothetical protein HF086_010825 [Spodoptera exigua]|uniref:DH domain-containing protein n=1 Tax=Spodoptera exigua TaxID=7107 RepID=A0A922SC57_SPOEX|nr:hypothetical protein HF086_010825 [Spodoptera exigua]